MPFQPNMNSISIRPAETDDYPAISALITSPEELFRVFPGGRYPFTVKQVHGLAERRSDLTVLTDRGKVVGFANLYGIEPQRWAFIGNVIVKGAHRGKGIGRNLVQHMADIIFTQHDLPEARISVFEDNGPAHSLYAKLGFKDYAEERRLNPDNRMVTLLHMRLGRGEAGQWIKDAF